MEAPTLQDLNCASRLTERYIRNHYKEFYDYLNENYIFCSQFQERLYCYFKGITERVVCPICGKPVNYMDFNHGYRTFCSSECAHNSEDVLNKIKNTKLERYGNSNYNNRESATKTNLERYGGVSPLSNSDIREKAKKTYKEKFGDECYQRTEDFKQKMKNTSIERFGVDNPSKSEEVKKKIVQTLLDHYGVDNYVKTAEYKERCIKTCLERYGDPSIDPSKITSQMQIPGLIDKINQTKKEHGTLNSSTIEKLFEKYLKDNNIEYKTQYKIKEYPFRCDFYLPKYNLYIEINAYWHHGKCIFDETNQKHIEELECWKHLAKTSESYKEAIKTWTIRDVEKRNTAKLNNLNYLEIFSNNINVCIKTLEEHINNM